MNESPAFEVMAAAPRLPPVTASAADIVSDTVTPIDPGADRSRAAFVDAVVELHATTTALHERFLRNQADFHENLCRLFAAPSSRPAAVERILDPAEHPWLADHRPSGTVPVLPGTATADLLAGAAATRTGCAVTGLRDVTFRDWITVVEPVRLRTEVSGSPSEPFVTLSVWRTSRYTPVATGYVVFGEQARPVRFAPLADAGPVPSPYVDGRLFHGPRMQYLKTVRANASGTSGVLDCQHGSVPVGTLHHGLLDAAMHTIAALPRRNDGGFLFPYRLDSLAMFDPLPTTGTVDVESRYAGSVDGPSELPIFDLQLCSGADVLAAFRMVFAPRQSGQQLRRMR
ncbi:hypothetical protein [Nocardia sp. NPDC051570]|uniref:hypothetical protein n=1 Tax=Nocardia sp. NPDC051570 TaxID=3364324 RepID=UPI0037A4BBFD